jgi:hypothetical protein
MSAKHAYAAAARRTGRLLESAGVLPRSVPPRERHLRHWLYSLPRVHDYEALNEMDVPWWTYRAIDWVEAWLAQRTAPVRVFEYGAGASTAFLSRRGCEVYAVENDAGFARAIQPMLRSAGGARLLVRTPTPAQHPRIASKKNGFAGLEFSDYVATIDEIGGVFDLIIIDGRARPACLAAALPHLSHDGAVIFDNSRRRRYREAIRASGLRERPLSGLTPTLPYPDRTSVLTRR